MLQYDFSQDPCFWVHMSAHRMECAANSELESAGITYRQAQILASLALEGRLTQTELAQRMRIQPPSVVLVLDRMERDGLIVRKNDPNDRRKRIVEATKKAVPIWERIVQCFQSVQGKFLQGLDPGEVKLLIELLQRVYANLDETDAAVPEQATAKNVTTETPGKTAKKAARLPQKKKIR